MTDEEYLAHYGMPRRSGRYPWGSGQDPYQSSRDFLGRVEHMRKSGFTYTDENGKKWTGDNAIAKSLGYNSTDFRTVYAIAKDERRSDMVATAKRLRDKEGMNNSEIGRKMGINESSVRSLLDPNSESRMKQARETAKFLKDQVDKKGMSIDKLQGLRVKIATVDEWLSGDIREDVIGALEQGAAKEQSGGSNDDYLIVAISSEGTVRNGSGDTIKMELMKILKGEYNAPHTSIWWYKLDSIDEVNDPDKWIKANPNLGKTVSYETYQLDVERAENNPAVRNDILAKRFGIPMEGYTYYFTYEETLPHRKREYWQMPCSMGADLSQGDDFCSFTFLFPLSNGAFGIKTRNYISELTLSKLPTAMRIKYNEFMKEGSLIVMPGNILDMMQVYEDLDNFIAEAEYDVRCLGYDPYNARDFVERWERENGPFGIEKVIQGAKTESVPLGELKKLSEERMLIFDEALMSFTMGNCIAIEDTNGNRKLLKRRHEAKIDAVAAMMDAFVAFKLNREAFE